jgi:hypothetical protein
MMYPCDLVAERLAVGEPLGADGDAHVAACPACARLVRLPGMVAATAREPEPGPGFAARMQVGARAELAARHRTRVAALTLATAAAVLLVGVFVTRRHHDDAQPGTMARYSTPQPISTSSEHHTQPVHDRATAATAAVPDDRFAARLVRISDIDDALAPSPAWHRIEAPLAPYRELLDNVPQGDH